MSIDRPTADRAISDHLNQLGRFDSVDLAIDVKARDEGWVASIRPANSYLRRHRPELTLTVFIDRNDGRVHHIPSFGLTVLLARLRSQR